MFLGTLCSHFPALRTLFLSTIGATLPLLSYYFLPPILFVLWKSLSSLVALKGIPSAIFCPQGYWFLHSSKNSWLWSYCVHVVCMLLACLREPRMSQMYITCLILHSSIFNEWMTLLCHLINISWRCHSLKYSRNWTTRVSTPKTWIKQHDSLSFELWWSRLSASQQMF